MVFMPGQPRPAKAGKKKGYKAPINAKELSVHLIEDGTCAAAIQKLKELAQAQNKSVAQRACETLLAYGYGKPSQQISLGNTDGQSFRVEIIAPQRGLLVNGSKSTAKPGPAIPVDAEEPGLHT